MSSPTAMPNRLAQATSPYLRQHAQNPVQWYPWGSEALERARREDRPVFLSIGYAACHWCHVMAHESFEDPGVAALLNESFVNIKVDREERPDIDELYMQATLVLNQGQGGWPMSVWLTPDLKPFFAGTYFPPTARHGRAGFTEICQSITRAWRQHREDIVGHAEQLTEVVRGALAIAPPVEELSLATVDAAAELLAGAFDTVSGGIVSGGTNKFPPSMALDVLLRSAARRAAGTARRQQFVRLVELTLEQMAAGGIYDQLGGGIHRYSTDVEWHVPHFEKMLYDQALVARSYLDAWQLSGRPLYARIATEICAYVLADLQAPQGGFYSARDADSEGVEGRYYVWSKAEVQAALGEEAELFCAHYDVRQGGNWRDPHVPDEPKSVLRALRSYDCCGKMLGLPREECARRLQSARQTLLEVRRRRTPPALDDKILCEWNGLMIASLARVGAALEQPHFVAAAVRAAEFILAQQWRDGRLRRSWRAGQTLEMAFLADYAALIEGLLELHEATFEWRWIERAVALNEVVCTQFLDRDQGAFFFTPHDHEPLLTRSKDARDGAVPSGNALQVMNLLRLAALLDDGKLRALAADALRALSGAVQAAPWAAERLLAAVDFAHAGPVEIAIVGDLRAESTQALLRTVHRTYLPNRVLVVAPATATPPPTPLLAARSQLNGEATAYICRAGTCHPPVTRVDELGALLSQATV